MMHGRARILSALITVSLVLPGTPATAVDTRVFHGICDGSAAVKLGHDTILVAYDEENAIYAYREGGGHAVARVDLSGLLNLTLTDEIDIEAAALAPTRPADWAFPVPTGGSVKTFPITPASNDPEHPAHDLRGARQWETQPIRKAQYRLRYWLLRRYLIHQ